MFTLENLSRAEKLRVMEALWRDLSANAADLTSPIWHNEALQQAETELSNGSARMVDWAEAKDTLRQRARS
ncbi:Putative addiction module component [Bordetella ansorpii]|uniref:Putative addiction module component n=1 Tax=Bordetella ansorpii TaxID=288768 RepID=A0A157SRV5_9BORD|nr:addiction module protein [Bordetella ansorpii]SAI73149.1 Putative addiction module component [Bordetella ansorpii]